MKILFLSSWFPYPTDNGSKIRIYNLLLGLARRHQITLLSFTDRPETDPRVPELQAICEKVIAVPRKAFNPTSLQASLGFFSPLPRSVKDTFSPEMAQQIQETLQNESFDLVIASQMGAAGYSRYFRGIPALLEEVEVAVPYESYKHATTPVQRFRRGLTWSKHRSYVSRVLDDFEACTVVSEREKRLLAEVIPGFKNVVVIPNCVDLAAYEGIRLAPQPDTLIFTGSFRFSANYDAMVWFLQDVYPCIQSQIPAVRLIITGDHAGLPLPPARNVIRTGFVEDVRSLIKSAWVSLVPIRVGGGTRLKILEAMALGTPVVSTTKGAEGLDVQDGKHLLIADSPETYAEAVVKILKDQKLREQISVRAYQRVREKYDWQVVLPCFLDTVERFHSV